MNDVDPLIVDGAGAGLPSRIVSRLRRDIPLVLLDAIVVVPAYLIPLALRFNGGVPSDRWRAYWLLLPVLVVIHLLSNYLFGLYGQMWRYASVQEARRVLLSGATSFILVLGVVTFVGAGQPSAPALGGRVRKRLGASWPSARSGSRAGCSGSAAVRSTSIARGCC